MAQVRDYTALLSGSSIAGKTQTGAFVSFSFPTVVPAYLRGTYSTEALASFRAFSDEEKAAVRVALGAFAAVSGLNFFEVAAGDGDLKFGNYDMQLMSPGSAGFAYYPDNGFGGDIASDVFIGNGNGTNQHILLHEIGHALGLKHSFDGATTLAPDLDNFANTVMSYTPGGSAGDRLGQLDIDAVHYLYGDENAKGRQVASWSWDQASLTLTQTGSETADAIDGIGGNDVVYGLGGNDTIRVRGGNNRVFGGDGDDTISGGSGYNVFDGGNGNDVLNGGSGGNELNGGSGDDRLNGGAGDDRLNGGAGNDTIFGGGGFDQVDAGDGADTISLSGTIARFAVDGGAGLDTLYLSPTLAAGATFSIPALLANGSTLTGIETVAIQISTTVTVIGSDIRDTITLGTGSDEVFAQAGDDYVTAGAGNDRVHGGDGADSLYGGIGSDTLWGDAGNDYLDGGGGIDLLYGGAGDDTLSLTLSGSMGGHVLDGGDGNDNAIVTTSDNVSRILSNATLKLSGIERLTLTSGGGADQIDITGISSVTIDGGAGDDVITFGNAAGSIYGGIGADFITAGTGFTFMYGGGGADRFIFLSGAASTSQSQDQLEDFQTGVDLVDITALSPTNVRIQSSNSGSWVYADSASGSFQVFVRGAIAMADVVTTGLVLSGTSGADRLVGTAGADRLSGGAGNDILSGGAGNDVLDGGADVDSAAYAGVFKTYAPSTVGGVTTLRGGVAEGTDTLTSVEYVTFKDGALISDPNSVGAQVIRLYDTVLDRAPDVVGLDYWVEQIQDRGASMAAVANGLIASAEFQAATGGLSNAGFVDYVYRQALGRAPDGEGKAYWTGRLDGGLSRGDLLIGFSESAEHRGATASLVAQGYFDTDDTYQSIALLYDSFAGRLPDADGLTYWGEQVKTGARSLGDVAAAFADSSEFREAIRGKSNSELVDFMYQNTLDRGPDAEGSAYWVAQLTHGLSRGGLLLAFSQSAEHYDLMASHITGGIDIF